MKENDAVDFPPLFLAATGLDWDTQMKRDPERCVCFVVKIGQSKEKEETFKLQNLLNLWNETVSSREE